MTEVKPKDAPVSRRRYDRARQACEEAERLLEVKSRQLFEANQRLKKQAMSLEQSVLERTRDLELAREAAESANEAKSLFLAAMSHEIRTPMNGVLGMAEALNGTVMSTEQREMLTLIKESGDALMGVINEILDLSKIEAGQLEVEEIPCVPAQIIESVVKLHHLKVADKGLALVMSVDHGLRDWGLCDPTRLRQVLGNLLSNAVKFTHVGYIRISARQEEGQLVLRVIDSGPGIKDSYREALFKPFTQATNAVSRQYGGTGLGLTISKRICGLLGGDLVYDPNPEGGAIFTATMALTPCEAPAQQSEDPDFEHRLNSRPRKVLVAEDNRTNQIVLEHMLKPYALDLTIVQDGKAALEAWETGIYEMILMDIQMPEMDGIEATTRIRTRENKRGGRAIPILALSANVMDHQVSQYLAQGMNGHVAKPFAREALAKEIARFCWD